MKKLLAILMAGALILGASACGKKEDEPLAPSADEVLAEKMTQGTVLEVAADSIVIDMGDGGSVSFSTKDADKTAAVGLAADDFVSVYYEGELKTGEGDMNTAMRLEKEDSTPIGDEEENFVDGTIFDAAMNTLVVTAEDGKKYSFFTEDADKTNADGLLIDSQVRVYYEGELTDAEGESMVAIRIEQ